MVTTTYLARTNFFCWEMYQPLAALQSVWPLRMGRFAHIVWDVEHFLDCHIPGRQDETYRFLDLLPVGLSEQYTLPGKVQRAGRSLPFDWSGCDNMIFSCYQVFLGDRVLRMPPGAWMFVCCECCVLSGRGLCDRLITRPEESYRLWRVVVCDQETSKTRKLKPATGLWKVQPQWVVTPGKQTNKQTGGSAMRTN
jgi:hypothetical protein